MSSVEDFQAALSRAVRFEVRPGLEATFIGLDDLLMLKREAGRPKDLLDRTSSGSGAAEMTMAVERPGRTAGHRGNGWEGHDEKRLLCWARVPLEEKLAWLEQMHRLVLTLQQSRRSRSSRDNPQ